MDGTNTDVRWLPPEIVDLILQELRPDPTLDLPSRVYSDSLIFYADVPHPNHDLASCALACRGWRELSRCHLFHTIAFSFKPEFKLRRELGNIDGNVLLRSDQRKLKMLDELVDFLESNQRITQFITNLTLHMDPLYDRQNQFHILYESPQKIARLAQVLSPSRLHVLNLCNVVLDDDAFEHYGTSEDPEISESNLQLSWEKCFPHIDTLTLRYNLDDDYTSSTSLCNIFTLFSSVDNLTFRDIHFDWSGSALGLMPNDLKIKHLTIRTSTNLPELVPRGSANESIKELLSLTIYPTKDVDEEDFEAVNDLLCQSGAHLKQFSYKLAGLRNSYDILDEHDFYLDFSSSHQLEKIALSFSIYPMDDGRFSDSNRSIWKGLAAMFSKHPAPNLKYVEFMINQDTSRPQVFEWDTPEIIQLESVFFNMPSLLNVHLSPGYGYDLYESQGRRTQRGPHSWIDAEFAMKLFCGLSTVDKLSVGGRNSLYRNTTTQASSAFLEHGRMAPFGSPSLQEGFLNEAEKRRKIHLRIDR